jgi:hypothetical protein
MAIGSISNNEAGLSVRAKLNAAISAVNSSQLHVSGRWYLSVTGTLQTGSASTSTQTRMSPVVIADAITISQLGARVTTASAGGNCIFAIYASDPTTLLPTGLPLGQSAANVSTGTLANVASTLTANVSLQPGLYWFAAQVDNSTATLQGIAAAFACTAVLVGGAQAQISSGAATTLSYLQYVSTYGTWPDVTAASITYGVNPMNVLQFFVETVP